VSGCTSSRSNQAAQDWQADERLEAMDGQTWVVGNHLVTLSPDAAVVGKPAIGSMVHVSGRRSDRGELLIDNVEVTSRPGTVAKATSTAGSDAKATPTPVPVAKATPTPITVPKATPTPAARRKPTAPPPARGNQQQGDDDQGN